MDCLLSDFRSSIILVLRRSRGFSLCLAQMDPRKKPLEMSWLMICEDSIWDTMTVYIEMPRVLLELGQNGTQSVRAASSLSGVADRQIGVRARNEGAPWRRPQKNWSIEEYERNVVQEKCWEERRALASLPI